MSITLHAQPYDLSAKGFYFSNVEEYELKVKALTNDYGDPVEEFEIQFIDGDQIDCELAEAIGLNQADFADYLEKVDQWESWEKTQAIIAYGDLGYGFEANKAAHEFDITVYQVRTMRELAEQFVDEGLFGEIPSHLENYIDFDAIARDLAVDHSEITIAGEHYVYSSN